MTKYGQALGPMQTLPGTAREMAGRLGVPYQESRLTSHAPQDIAYGRQLGEAYLQEGYNKTGNVRDALRYYHGGPNRKLWGHDTNAYANGIMSRLK